MFLTSRLVFTVLIVLWQFYYFAQETNVLLPQKRFTTNHLKTTRFNDGSSLEIVHESNENYTILWSKNVNQAQVLITDVGEYLYNYKAINDQRNLCPEGFKVIEKKDLQGIPLRTILESKSSMTNKFSQGELIISNSQVLIDSSNCDNKNDLRILIDPINSIGLKGELLSNEDGQKSLPVLGYDNRLKNNQYVTAKYYNTGLPIRCVEVLDYNNYFSKNTFSYKSLRFENLENVTDSLKLIIQNGPKVDVTTNVMLIVEFNEFGKIKSKSFSNPNYRELDLLTMYIKDNLERPFYQSINIKTIDTLIFSIVPNTKRIERNELYSSNFSSQFTNYIRDKKLQGYINSCIQLKPRALYKLPNNIVTFATPFESNYTFPSLKKVICPGPLNSILAIIPGLGVYQFNQTNLVFNSPHRILLSTSLSLAAIGIASKAISITFYNHFRYNLDGPDAAKNYKIANTSQKVFVVSSALYAGLALVDFTWTFSLGVKSKNLQHKTNKELRTMHKQNLWL